MEKYRGQVHGLCQGVEMSEEERGVEEVKEESLPCSASWFCAAVMAKGVGDEEGEVE